MATTFSNRYIFIYSIVMVTIVAITLTIVAIGLKPLQERNIRIEKMQNILTSVNIDSDVKNAELLYEKYFKNTFVINNKGDEVKNINAFNIDLYYELKKKPADRFLPVYVCEGLDSNKYFVVPLRGKGLWGPIWGYISFKQDFNTIYGAMFDHKGETPGLGAEINTLEFRKQFFGKQIFAKDSSLTSVKTIKGGAADDDIHGVDAISGGTITSNGLSDMLINTLSDYKAYFKKRLKL
ncbi:MAG: NADH:ubiquinone reductase (Na(+)-transporting) subunit C [Bacteroidales bacterium]|nr:NADH:ubiquinone reductase (Na(+)-transporting) subunit C [Bacteroidales bacterium]